MKLCLIVLMCMLVGAFAFPGVSQAKAEWTKFKALHKKVYKNVSEDLFRLKVFLKNKMAIIAHNLKFKTRLVSFKAKINKFADLLGHEIVKFANGIKKSLIIRRTDKGFYTNSGKPLPPSADCRKQNLVNTPRHQGTCGSCWTFSTTGSIEGQLARKTGKLVALSQQYLMDCSFENDGCEGGLMTTAFEFVQRSGGIVTEASYPYSGVKGQCKFEPANVAANVTGYYTIRDGSDADLQDALINIGPISVAMDANSTMLKFYDSGVFDVPSSECSSVDVNHAVLAVGYGSEGDKDYWLIKNSWGTDWGEGGFLKILKNGKNYCGITGYASFPTI